MKDFIIHKMQLSNLKLIHSILLWLLNKPNIISLFEVNNFLFFDTFNNMAGNLKIHCRYFHLGILYSGILGDLIPKSENTEGLDILIKLHNIIV